MADVSKEIVINAPAEKVFAYIAAGCARDGARADLRQVSGGPDFPVLPLRTDDLDDPFGPPFFTFAS